MSVAGADSHRLNTDVMKLFETNHEITLLRGLNDFHVKFFGPHGTPYEGGVWRVRVQLADEYPLKSPSIGFVNKIFHPNIDEESGLVCMDVINQAWSAMYDLVNIMDSFLPQLLTYPNPKDPLNSEAAALYLREPPKFRRKAADYVRRFATVSELVVMQEPESESSDTDTFMSEFFRV